MRSLSRVPDPAVAFVGQLRCRLTNRNSVWPWLCRGVVAGATSLGIVIAFQVFAAGNLHTVVPGRAFRAAQMNPNRLQSVIRQKGIRTVVNLRGYCPDFDWYRQESRATHDANVNLEDVTLSAIRLPTPSEIRRLVDLLDHCEYPILMHCRQGVDRTGLAAAIVKLLEPGESLAAAERQLSFAYGYVPYNGTEHMQRFLDLYREWLQNVGVQHSPALFREWAVREYCPGACRAEIELLDWPIEQQSWPPNEGRSLHIRLRNRSIRTWVFRPGTNQGIHARYAITDISGKVIRLERAGLRDAIVSPGESIDLELGIPPLASGRYGLTIDLIDVDQNAFSQFGMEPMTREFRVGAN